MQASPAEHGTKTKTKDKKHKTCSYSVRTVLSFLPWLLYIFLLPLSTMASSRWKRFAFFERNTLSLSSEVLEDIIPRSSSSLNRKVKANNDAVSLVVTTAALPMNSKPKKNSFGETDLDAAALTDMWSSLAACAPMEVLEESGSIRLPSQAQSFEDDSNVNTLSGTALDGLVLVFITSEDTDYIHCFDVTVRCNPPDSSEKDLEDFDGWRGYLAPFKGKEKPVRTGAGQPQQQQSLEDRIVSEHMEPERIEGINGIATCRASSGHRPLHMACITRKNVAVCVDPQLYLSW
jgi:hypothetical protein